MSKYTVVQGKITTGSQITTGCDFSTMEKNKSCLSKTSPSGTSHVKLQAAVSVPDQARNVLHQAYPPASCHVSTVRKLNLESQHMWQH